MKSAVALVVVAALCGAANAAVVINDGAGPVASPTSYLDFDTPFVASGPVAGNAFAGFNFAFLGTWTPGTDTITAGSNGSGQSLGSQRGAGAGAGPGALAVMGVGGAIDNVAAGGGLQIGLTSPTTAFSWLFVDQINMAYTVELFDGATSLGTATTTYAGSFPRPESNVNAAGAQFDRIHVTFNAAVTGIAFDKFGYAAIPAPASLALLGLTTLVAGRRRR